MKHSKLILAGAVMLFSGLSISAQKKKPAATGSIEIPKDTQVHVIPDEKGFRDIIDQINEAVELKFDENYEKGQLFITLGGEPQLMYKAKCNANNVDRKLNARIYHCTASSPFSEPVSSTFMTGSPTTEEPMLLISFHVRPRIWELMEKIPFNENRSSGKVKEIFFIAPVSHPKKPVFRCVQMLVPKLANPCDTPAIRFLMNPIGSVIRA